MTELDGCVFKYGTFNSLARFFPKLSQPSTTEPQFHQPFPLSSLPQKSSRGTPTKKKSSHPSPHQETSSCIEHTLAPTLRPCSLVTPQCFSKVVSPRTSVNVHRSLPSRRSTWTTAYKSGINLLLHQHSCRRAPLGHHRHRGIGPVYSNPCLQLGIRLPQLQQPETFPRLPRQAFSSQNLH